MVKWPSAKQFEQARKEASTGIASKLLPKNASHSDILKYLICEKLIIHKHKMMITTRQLSEDIGIKESSMNKILHYHNDDFTINRLLGYLSKVYPDFQIRIDLAE